MNKRGQGDVGVYFQRVWQADLTGETNHTFQIYLLIQEFAYILTHCVYVREKNNILNSTTYSIQLYLFVSTANS